MFRRDKNIILKKPFENTKFDLLYNSNEHFGKSEASVDDITWNDLNMDSVFTEMNYTVSSPGEETLYTWLKNPLVDSDSLSERGDLIDSFALEDSEIKEFRLKLSKLRYCKFDVIDSLENNFLVNNKLLLLFSILALLNLCLIGIGFAFELAFVFPIILVTSSITIYCHFRFLLKNERQLEVLRYVLKLIGISRKYTRSIEQVVPDKYEKLMKLNRKLNALSNGQATFYRMEGLDVLADYINIIFLMKEIRFLLTTNKINRHRNEIIELYKLVGEFDALMSINEYRRSMSYYSVPAISKEDKTLVIKGGMYHPLVENPVSNKIDMNRSIVITGSNMSGKSTFLRTLSINTILCQSIYTSLSKQHIASCFKVITSISLQDNVLEGKSYFMMEAEAIQRMLESKDSNLPSLVAIDEIFKGTNPVERLAAATEILNELSQANTLTVVATHDLQILPDLIMYDYYYFTENVTKHSLDFDYKLHSGISPTRNAVKLLEYIKYPDEIIDKINNRIELLEV